MRKQVYAATIGVLLVLSFFAVLQFWQIKPVYAATSFGYDTVGGSQWTVGKNLIVTSNFTLTEDGSVTEIASYRYSGTWGSHYKYAIFSSDGLTFKGNTTEGYDTSGGVWAWYPLSIVGTCSLTVGNYLVCTWADCTGGGEYIKYDDGTTNQAFNMSQTYASDTWPTSLTVETYFARKMSIYVNYTASGATTPSSTVFNPTSTKNFTSSIISAEFNASAGGNISMVFVDTNVSSVWSGNVTLRPTWKNSTACWGNYTMLLPATVGTVVGYRWFANDTSNKWVDSGNYTLTITANTIDYSENAVWIQDAAWGAFPTARQNILTANLSSLSNELGNYSIKYAVVFVGYWNATSNNINYQHNAAFYANVISVLHANNIKVLAWAEDGGGGTMDIRSTNRNNIYNSIITCMYYGFDGYHDDIETYTGTLQEWIDYNNNCTTILHSMGKLMTAAVPYDWLQNINMHLYMDYIFSMFYGGGSIFEDSQAVAYWQENFGIYGSDHGAATSPMILGIMNFYGNTYHLPWQLARCANFMNAYSNRSLVGFCLWLWEYVTSVRVDDWLQWNYWVSALDSTPAVLHSVGVGTSPIVNVPMIFQGSTVYTNTSLYTFNISLSVTATASHLGETISSLLGMTNHTQSGGYYSYTYCSGPYTLSSPITVTSLYYYAKASGNVKLAIYNSTSYTIPGWVGTNEHPHVLQVASIATACTINTWNLVNVSSTGLAIGNYFFVIKFDTNGMLSSYTDGTSNFYGHGQYITQSYNVAFSSTFPTVEGGIGADPSIFIPSAPISYTTYTFTQWDDASTNVVRTISTVTSNITLTATYNGTTVPILSIMYPANITYDVGTIPVNFTASGGTIDIKSFNVLNGTSGSTWVYVSNQTFTSYTTISGFVNGTYTFYAYANNTTPSEGYGTMVFTVQIITSEGGTTQLIVNVWWSSWW